MTTIANALRGRPRLLHAGAWWLWALALAGAASRTTNPLLLALIIGVTALVVASRCTSAPWTRSYAAALKLGALVIAIRLVFQLLFGAGIGTTVLITLPEIPLPAWAVGVRIGGEVTLEGMIAGFYDGLRLATILACVGAANALTGPTRLLKSVPGALYEMGVAVVVALSLAPQLVIDVQRVREARRLRGRTTRGARGLQGLLAPVLDGSLRRSLDLAAAMDARGYGRSAHVPVRQRRATAVLMVTGLIGVAIGIYGVLDGGAPPVLGLPMLGVGVALAAGGIALGGRRTPRSRYRPDPWRTPEWLVVVSGALATVAVVLTASRYPDIVLTPVSPLAWPQLSAGVVLGLLVAAVPAWCAPTVPEDIAPLRRTPQPRPVAAEHRIEVAA